MPVASWFDQVECDPPVGPGGGDGAIINVVRTGNLVDFTGVGIAFNGTMTLPGTISPNGEGVGGGVGTATIIMPDGTTKDDVPCGVQSSVVRDGSMVTITQNDGTVVTITEQPAGGADGVITNVSNSVDPEILVFTGVSGGFNGSITIQGSVVVNGVGVGGGVGTATITFPDGSVKDDAVCGVQSSVVEGPAGTFTFTENDGSTAVITTGLGGADGVITNVSNSVDPEILVFTGVSGGFNGSITIQGSVVVNGVGVGGGVGTATLTFPDGTTKDDAVCGVQSSVVEGPAGTFTFTENNGSTAVITTGPADDFFREVVTGTLPNNLATDPSKAIRRLGDIGLGGNSVLPVVPDVTTPAGDNAVFSLSPGVGGTGRSQVLYGTAPLSYYATRTMPVGVDGFVEIGRFTFPNATWSHRITITVADPSFSVSKSYTMNWSFAQWPAGVTVLPNYTTGAFSGNDFDLIARPSGATVHYRIRRFSGSTAGTLHIRIESVGSADEVFEESTLAGTDATVYPYVDVPGEDFWRSDAGTLKPNGVTDLTEAIHRTGLVGIGAVQSQTPVATLDVALGNRSGADQRVPGGTPVYITGPLDDMLGAATSIYTEPANAVEIYHSDQTRGIGLTRNGIFATGTDPDNEMNIWSKGGGHHTRGWPNRDTGFCFWDWQSTQTPSAGTGFTQRWHNGGSLTGGHFHTTETFGPLTTSFHWTIVANAFGNVGSLATQLIALRLRADLAEEGNTSLVVGEDRLHNRKIVLHKGTVTSAHEFFGLGVTATALRYQVNASTSEHAWFASTSPTVSNALVTFHGDGNVSMFLLPVFANDGAAGALAAGMLYRTASGEVRIKL